MTELNQAADTVEEDVIPKMAPGKTFLAKMDGGKIMQCYRGGRSGHYIVEFADGGVVPKALEGEWTKLDMLKLQVDKYLNK